jgi:hypothetical protein
MVATQPVWSGGSQGRGRTFTRSPGSPRAPSPRTFLCHPPPPPPSHSQATPPSPSAPLRPTITSFAPTLQPLAHTHFLPTYSLTLTRSFLLTNARARNLSLYLPFSCCAGHLVCSAVVYGDDACTRLTQVYSPLSVGL